MDSKPEVSFVGSGNVATHLCLAFHKQGIKINEIFNPTYESARSLASSVGAKTAPNLDFTGSYSSVFLICVPDDTIVDIVTKIVVPGAGIVVHTSGTVSTRVFSDSTFSFGVFYPLQTFTKATLVDHFSIPLFLEASDPNSLHVLDSLAATISNKVHHLTSEERQILHLSAVFGSNFVNNLLSISTDILGSIGLNPEVLKPLVFETVNKAYKIGPESAQTGPASRNDQLILDAHRELLRKSPVEYLRIYEEHTKSILKSKGQKS